MAATATATARTAAATAKRRLRRTDGGVLVCTVAVVASITEV
jgi:hypothetical protein